MIGRPENAEAAPYYFTYINLVTGDDAAATMEGQLEESLTFFSSISEEKSLYRYAREKWSIRQVLNHVTDTERAFAFRALWFARGFEAPLPSYDQNIAASGAEADRVGWAGHIEEFRSVRLSSISLFSNMPPEGWMRTGVASDNRFTVRALAYITAGHLTHHVRILRDDGGHEQTGVGRWSRTCGRGLRLGHERVARRQLRRPEGGDLVVADVTRGNRVRGGVDDDLRFLAGRVFRHESLL